MREDEYTPAHLCSVKPLLRDLILIFFKFSPPTSQGSHYFLSSLFPTLARFCLLASLSAQYVVCTVPHTTFRPGFYFFLGVVRI